VCGVWCVCGVCVWCVFVRVVCGCVCGVCVGVVCVCVVCVCVWCVVCVGGVVCVCVCVCSLQLNMPICIIFKSEKTVYGFRNIEKFEWVKKNGLFVRLFIYTAIFVLL
jgi:hypothetical protein